MDRVEQVLVKRIAAKAKELGDDPEAAVACFQDTADEDILAGPADQCAWLTEAGFEQPTNTSDGSISP